MLDLEAIELIKQLKARYFRFMDTGHHHSLCELFTDDAVLHFKGGHYELQFNGRQEIEEFYSDMVTDKKFGMHNGHHPEITVDGDVAEGIWYLQDIFINFERMIRTTGTALYRDRYQKVKGEWKIV